ncbi:MAG: amidohydrolase family protein [Bacteroidetes bacterium]|nr:amidohydrolase family protein [Bacteroidota bacterium]
MTHSTRLLLSVVLLLVRTTLPAQVTFPTAAPSDERSGLHAFTNATIYTDYKTSVDKATLLIKEGRIVAVGAQVSIPKNAAVHDCTGKTIYPAFIDLYATGYGLPAAAAGSSGGGGFRQQALTNKKGAYAWNEALHPEYNAADVFSNDPKAAEEYRKIGFGAVLTHQPDGISRGTGALVTLCDEREHEQILLGRAAHFMSFRKGSSTQNYPSSLMGCIALIRQTYLDGQWYKLEGFKKEKNLSLEAWNALLELPQFFESTEKLDLFRIARIGQEFGVKYIVKSAGDDYQRLSEIAATGQPLILPLNFPEGYDLRDPYAAMNVPLRDLKHWELAPSNPAMVQQAGIPFALSTNGLREKGKFWENLRKAVEYGLSEEAALKALTFTPASLVRAYEQVGSLEPGKVANFIITNGSLFKLEGKIYQNWVKGNPYDIAPDKSMPADALGVYDLKVGANTYTLTVKGKPEAPEAQIMRADSSKTKATLNYSPNGVVLLSFQLDTVKKATVSLSGVAGAKEWIGQGTLPDGAWVDWKATFLKPAADNKPGKQAPVVKNETGDIIYPFTAFGWKEKPVQQTVLIQNATVWTSEKESVLPNTDVLISNGKILKIGKKLPVQDNATVVDGTGKYLTAGIIDEHSHIAVSRSVNEGSQESSAEVRVGDAIDSEDNDIYRQLAGGVTTSHLLHGSANPIGGQTQLIKLRWGAAPEELKFQNWPGFIKFALGENVKHSNVSSSNRFPQTRMGVEQVYVDYFTRAREYGLLKKSGKPYRKDLELEALLEILESKRFITCHSYVQSEITMMMRVAERFGFRLNTFTHILEGYKVADKMAQHGAGASTFSDWWAYKYEVVEAIPQNARLMTDRGVTVAINSDDAEMARRLNQEAAKSILYTGMKEEDAWKMVTINPAKLLHIEQQTGSIKVGKDADLVLWNNNPLSVYARAEKTWVDGILFFDRQEDARMQEWVRTERARLIQKIQAAKKGGEGGEKPSAPRGHYHCDSEEDEG